MNDLFVGDHLFARYLQSLHDTETFRMNVGTLNVIDWTRFQMDIGKTKLALDRFAAMNNIGLVACAVNGRDPEHYGSVQDAGFRFIESRLFVEKRSCKFDVDDSCLSSIRAFDQADAAHLIRIATSVFWDGRFLSDPRMNREDGLRRYGKILVQTIERTRTDTNWHVFVIGEVGDPKGFLSCEFDGEHCRLDLGAADIEKGSSVAYRRIMRLWSGVVLWASRNGAKRYSAQIGANNTTIGSVYCNLGFTPRRAEVMFHKHYF